MQAQFRIVKLLHPAVGTTPRRHGAVERAGLGGARDRAAPSLRAQAPVRERAVEPRHHRAHDRERRRGHAGRARERTTLELAGQRGRPEARIARAHVEDPALMRTTRVPACLLVSAIGPANCIHFIKL